MPEKAEKYIHEQLLFSNVASAALCHHYDFPNVSVRSRSEGAAYTVSSTSTIWLYDAHMRTEPAGLNHSSILLLLLLLLFSSSAFFDFSLLLLLSLRSLLSRNCTSTIFHWICALHYFESVGNSKTVYTEVQEMLMWAVRNKLSSSGVSCLTCV